jgi:hypothetical protein
MMMAAFSFLGIGRDVLKDRPIESRGPPERRANGRFTEHRGSEFHGSLSWFICLWICLHHYATYYVAFLVEEVGRSEIPGD